MTLVRMSIQVNCNTTFPITVMFFFYRGLGIVSLTVSLAEKDTLTLLQRACSSMTIPVQGKALFHPPPYCITTEPLWLSNSLKVQFNFQPLDGPFNQEIPPTHPPSPSFATIVIIAHKMDDSF